MTSLNDRLESYLKERPGMWIDGKELARHFGGYGWRSRVSDVRRRGLTIENQQRCIYMHDYTCPATGAWDVPGACNCDQRRLIISEYRYLPEPVSVNHDGQAELSL